MIVLVLGGGRSGKSAYAERVAQMLGEEPSACCYLATGEACDEEMRVRIAKHQLSRGTSFFTVEEPVNIAKACRQLPSTTRVVLLDCVTTWLGNISYRQELAQGNAEPGFDTCDVAVAQLEGQQAEMSVVGRAESAELIPLEESLPVREWLEFLPQAPFHVVMVANEVGLGLVPGNAMSRAYRDSAGRLNQRLASLADEVCFMVAGLPLVLKGKGIKL